MRLSIDSAEVYAYTGSRALLPAQRSIMFVHGAANDHSVWALQSRYFAHHGYNVMALDLPGHGLSGGDALPSVDAIADWLVHVLDAAGVERAVLVGHSLGSLAALACGARHPDRVTKLALLGTAVPMPVSDALLAAAHTDEHLAYELINGWSHSQRRQLGGNQVPGMWMTGGSLRLMERTGHGVLHADLLACRAYSRGLEDAAAVRVPVLAVVGSRDVMVPPKSAQPLITALSECKVVSLPGSGHAMMAEQPDAVLDALRAFV